MASPKKVEPIPVLIDTAEQLPWTFDAGLFTTERADLMTGDYSIPGLEDILTIERKSLGDAVSTTIHDWRRFRKQLYRMAGMDCAIVVIEGSVEDILLHKYESDADPLSVLGKLISITIDHAIPVVFAGSRECAMEFAARYLIQCAAKLRFLSP